jgi:hypothetical protein
VSGVGRRREGVVFFFGFGGVGGEGGRGGVGLLWFGWVCFLVT